MFGVVYRSNVRRMWSVKSKGEEERFAGFVRMIFLHELDGGQSSLAVSVVLILAIKDSPTQGAAIGTLSYCDDFIEFRAINANGVHYLVP